MHPRFSAAAVLAAAALAAACSSTNSFLHGKQIDYKSAQTLPSLEVPPDLTAPSGDNRYAVSGPTTASGYQAERTQQGVASGNTVLPEVADMHIERDGNERWLVVANETPAQLWPQLKEFWQANGFLVELDEPKLGVMQTNWAENRAKLPSDVDRFTLARVLGPLYSTGERDRFRTRLERTPDGKGTEIYISHYGLKEVYSGADKVTTAWEPRAPDPGLEAIFLRRLMVQLGAKKEAAQQQVAAASVPGKPMAQLRTGRDGVETLEVFEPFDRAWRRVGLALDRVGFTVEDRNRDKGVYYVRYADPAGQQTQEKKGLFSWLAFWRSDKNKVVAEQYRVMVKDAKDNSIIQVQDKAGANLNSSTAHRILSLLNEQLK